MSSSEREVSEYIPLYKELLAAGIDFVIIGGQACNIWALLYEAEELGLRQYKPYTSTDLDLYSRSQTDVSKAAQHLKVEPILGDSGSSAPVMGYVVVEIDEAPILIQFLNGAAGITRAGELFKARQTVELTDGLRLNVMHPVHALQSKLTLAGKRGHKIQQDLKHLNMSILFVRAFILKTASNNQRTAIALCKRVVEQAKSMEGIRIFHRFQVLVEESIPRNVNTDDLPTFGRFLRDSLPHLLKKVASKRRKKATSD